MQSTKKIKTSPEPKAVLYLLYLLELGKKYTDYQFILLKNQVNIPHYCSSPEQAPSFPVDVLAN